MRRLPAAAWSLALACAASVLHGAGDEPQPIAPFEASVAGSELVVRRGEFRRRILLTGELKATRAIHLIVPHTRAWGVQIRWLIEDGAHTEPGEPVIEFDDSTLRSELEDFKLSAVEAADELARVRLRGAAETAELTLAAERARIERDKARVEAEVPEGLLARRDHQERALALRRAEVNWEKAVEELDSRRRTSDAEQAIRQLTLERVRRRIARVERDLEALRLRSPERGIALVETHPWEARKLRVGDTVWPGMTLVTLPDLSSLEVEARLIDVDDGKIAAGMPALCRLDAYPLESHPCRVEEISPVAMATSAESLRRGFTVRLGLDRTDSERMRPGMSVAIEVESRLLADVLLAPRSALDVASDPPRILLADGGATEVALGDCNGLLCVVERGIEEGRALRARQETR